MLQEANAASGADGDQRLCACGQKPFCIFKVCVWLEIAFDAVSTQYPSSHPTPQGTVHQPHSGRHFHGAQPRMCLKEK